MKNMETLSLKSYYNTIKNISPFLDASWHSSKVSSYTSPSNSCITLRFCAILVTWRPQRKHRIGLYFPCFTNSVRWLKDFTISLTASLATILSNLWDLFNKVGSKGDCFEVTVLLWAAYFVPAIWKEMF